MKKIERLVLRTDALQKHLAERGLSPFKLSKEIGVSGACIYGLMSRKAGLSGKMVIRLMDFTGLSFEELFLSERKGNQ